MAFQKGHKLGKGRPPGSPNKRRSIEDMCLEAGVDPFAVMIMFLRSPDDAIRFQSAKELCQYLEAKKKQMEIAIDPEANTIEVIIKRYGK